MVFYLFTLLAAGMVLVGLMGCVTVTSGPERDHCVPLFVTKAQDGTTLWRVSSMCGRIQGSYDVYFSSAGTKVNVSTGRSSRPVYVPNAVAGQRSVEQ